VQDHPGKLTEVSEEFWSADPLIDIPQWIAKGADTEEVAEKTNGTRYTAYINDLTLAKKIVSVSLEANEYFSDPHKAKESQEDFHQALIGELERKQPLSIVQMMNLLVRQPTRLAKQIYQAWKEEVKLKILFASRSKIDKESENLGQIVACQNLFKKGE